MVAIHVISALFFTLASTVSAAPLEYETLNQGSLECEGWRGNLSCNRHSLSEEEQLAIAKENPGVAEEYFERFGLPSLREEFTVVRDGVYFCSACSMTNPQLQRPSRVKSVDGIEHDLFTIASDPGKQQFVYTRYCSSRGKPCDHLTDLSRIRGSVCRQQRQNIAMLAIDAKTRQLYPVIVSIPYGCRCYIAR